MREFKAELMRQQAARGPGPSGTRVQSFRVWREDLADWPRDRWQPSMPIGQGRWPSPFYVAQVENLEEPGRFYEGRTFYGLARPPMPGHYPIGIFPPDPVAPWSLLRAETQRTAPSVWAMTRHRFVAKPIDTKPRGAVRLYGPIAPTITGGESVLTKGKAFGLGCWFCV